MLRDGAFVHVNERGDFVDVVVLELPPGTATEPQKHLYEEVVYVLGGRGSTTIETTDGRSHSFEWGPKSLFRASPQPPLLALQRQRLGAGATLLYDQRADRDEPLPQRGIRL